MVDIGGQPVRVRGVREMDDRDKAALAEIVDAAKRYLTKPEQYPR